jgi:class 3 adenylate cyclase
MRCAACGTEHDESARFCGRCGAAFASRCSACGASLQPDLRFCTSCGTAVTESHRAGSALEAPVAERRRISVVFLDLEDFTTLAENLDPEEVRAVQSRYFETARGVIARHGGTVEKFIGDAVVAIWGAPTAHEDDATRAVHAALALVDAVGRLGGATTGERLSGRASVATGEVATSVGAVGHGLVAGDLVNVASRLQGRAPAGEVLVDEATRALAPGAAIYRALGELELKGRQSTIVAHRALPGERGAAPERAPHGGPFVGRERELSELLELHDGVFRNRRSRLVSIIGIAGIGKSRLAWELARQLGSRPGLVAWHAGRSPAYGEGITFAAVAEMVRQRIRAPAGTAPEIERRQLSTSLAELVRETDERRWLEPRLAALLGHERLDAIDRDELFAAWRRYFERVSEATPVVLAFEDLQWADAALVDFVEHLATWARLHPILILALARPELLDRRPTWGTGVGPFTVMPLERLPDADMRSLLRLRAPQLDDVTIDRVLEHAGGVPLYAVEVARSLADSQAAGRGPAAPHGPDRRASPRRDGPAQPAIAVPDSLHGIIAARIDALPAGERRLLLAAAVLGRRFSLEALSAIGADLPTLRPRLASLVQRELLGIDETDPSRTQLSFVQDVVRDVAYRTLARQGRRTLHLAAARWLEAVTEADVAEPLAGHLLAVHQLGPKHPDARRIARRAVSALRRAAAAAISRHAPERALGHLEHALRLTDGPEQRAVVLDEAASAGTAAGRLDLAEAHLRELATLQFEADHRRDAARTRARLAGVLLTAQRNEPAILELEKALRAIRHVDRDAAGVELAAQLARARMLIGDDAGGLQWAERGLEAARRLGLDGVAADLLVTRGTARVHTGDAAGLDDLHLAISEAALSGALRTELRARNNLAWLLAADDPRATLEIAREAVSVAATMGVGDMAAQLAEVACAAAIDTGEWTWAIGTAEDLLHPGTPLANRLNLAAAIGVVRAFCGDPAPLAALDSLPEQGDDLDEQVRAGIVLARAWTAFTGGDLAAAIDGGDAAASVLLDLERLQALVLATRARLWGGDAPGARAGMAHMEAAGVTGRVAEAHLATVRAGVLALEDPRRGPDAYRAAADAWRSLGLEGQLAICLVDEARMLGRRPGELPALLDRLGAEGLRRLVDGDGASAG